LADLPAVGAELRLTTPSGLRRLLKRLRVHWKRGRDYVHSPDRDYQAKLAAIAAVVAAGRRAQEGVVTLFLDECTYYRQPTVAPAYERAGRVQARAERSLRPNTPTRLLATLDVRDGRVIAYQGSHITTGTLVAFYQRVCAAYPEARRIAIIQDNWPVHWHPDVLAALEPQESPWPGPQPASWPRRPSARAVQRWGQWQLPIQIVPLPTYASWANPIEKLWRKLRQELLHLHRLADHLPDLRAVVAAFLAQFAHGSPDLLRYVGLHVPP
jgi:hypothetical protein